MPLDIAISVPGFGSIVGVIFPLLTILAVGGCALLYGVQTTLRANNGDLDKRVAILEAEGVRKDAQIAAQQKEIDGQRAELATLGKVVTGEAYLVAISDLVTEHHAQAVREWQTINGTLTEILGLLKKDRP